MNPSPACVLCKGVNSIMNQGNFLNPPSFLRIKYHCHKRCCHHHQHQQTTTITISSILGNFYKVYDTPLSHTWKYTTKQQDLNVAQHKLVQQRKVTLVFPHWKQSPVTSSPTGCIHEVGQQRVMDVLVGCSYCRIYVIWDQGPPNSHLPSKFTCTHFCCFVRCEMFSFIWTHWKYLSNVIILLRDC